MFFSHAYISIYTYSIVLAMKIIDASDTVRSNNLEQICTVAAAESQISLKVLLFFPETIGYLWNILFLWLFSNASLTNHAMKTFKCVTYKVGEKI